MKRATITVLCLLLLFSGRVFAESSDDQVDKDYLDLIDQHIAKLSAEYGVTTETETLLARRAIESYIVADLVDYTLLIFMAKYNVATGGIDMKKANAEILRSLKELSESSNRQMLANLNMLRSIKKVPMVTPEAEAEPEVAE